MDDAPSQIYRRVIDRLAHDTLHGQGQTASAAIRRGVWNPHVATETHPDVGINELLARLSDQDRAILAEMVAESFRSGVHQTLVTLHEEAIIPFDRGYEGTPFHDYIGRVNGWEWPQSPDARRW